MRKLVALMGLIVIGAFIAGAGTPGSAGGSAGAGGAPQDAGHAAHAATTTPQDPPGTIDGAVTPHLIPDSVAYGLLFNFFAERAEGERSKLQAYCDQSALAGVSLDALLAAAAHYRQRVAPIDLEAHALGGGTLAAPGLAANPHSAANAQLTRLRAQREAVVSEVIATLPSFVGPAGAQALRKHIDERVKLKTKIIPGPMMPHEEK